MSVLSPFLRSGSERQGALSRAPADAARGAPEIDPEVLELLSQLGRMETEQASLENFVFVAAHDLRAPLRRIDELASQLQTERASGLSEDSAAQLVSLRTHAESLKNVLDSLLRYSIARIDTVVQQEINLRPFVDDIMASANPKQRFSIGLTCPEHPVWTYATPLHHILLNLISNAVAHHDRERGSIEIDAQIKGTRGYFRVSDDGPGMNNKNLADHASQENDVSFTDRNGQNGLGLAIVHRLVERHGGNLRITPVARDGRGVTIAFDFPVCDAPKLCNR